MQNTQMEYCTIGSPPNQTGGFSTPAHFNRAVTTPYSGSSANPATVNRNVLAQLFGVDEVLVLESTYNAAAQGATADMQYVCDPTGMLLCYTTGAPAIDEPSAGYIFAWDMLGAGQHMAVTNFQGAPGTHSEFVESLCSFDMQQVSTDLAVYCKGCVSAT